MWTSPSRSKQIPALARQLQRQEFPHSFQALFRVEMTKTPDGPTIDAVHVDFAEPIEADTGAGAAVAAAGISALLSGALSRGDDQDAGRPDYRRRACGLRRAD